MPGESAGRPCCSSSDPDPRVLRQLAIQNSVMKFFKPFSDVLHARDECEIYPGYAIFFGLGSFDDWCAWLRRDEDGLCAMARDRDYLKMLDDAAAWFPPVVLWEDVLGIFRASGAEVSGIVLEDIRSMSGKYRGAEAVVGQVLLHLYYGMVSDSNRPGYRLGGKVKALAARRLLLEGLDAQEAADESRTMSYGELLAMCDERGIK